MQKETGRWKIRWKIRDLLADGRCGQAVLDFLSSTDVGRLVLPLEESDAGSEVSEWELRERRERGEEREVEAEELGAAGELGVGGGGGGDTAVPTHAPLHGIRRRGVGLWGRFPLLFPLSLSLLFPWCALHLRGTGLGGGQKGSLQCAATARTADRKTAKCTAMIYRSYASMSKQKKSS